MPQLPKGQAQGLAVEEVGQRAAPGVQVHAHDAALTQAVLGVALRGALVVDGALVGEAPALLVLPCKGWKQPKTEMSASVQENKSKTEMSASVQENKSKTEMSASVQENKSKTEMSTSVQENKSKHKRLN